MPKIACTDEEIESCFDVMSELRAHLKINELLPLVRRMELDGYRMAYVMEEGRVVAVAGLPHIKEFVARKTPLR
jgi:hypothetical protein